MNGVKPVKTLMLGHGYWGPNLLRNLDANNKCDVVGICDIRADSLAKAATKYPYLRTFDNYDTALEQSGAEAVVIATPSGLHPQHIRSALRAGCHVFVEKPFAETVTDAIALNDAALKGGRTLMVGHTFFTTISSIMLKAASTQVNWWRFCMPTANALTWVDSVRIRMSCGH